MQMLAEELFARLECLPAGSTFTATLGMLEIYNERRVVRLHFLHAGSQAPGLASIATRCLRRVRDLLAGKGSKQTEGLRIRESPERGPYVEGLVVRPVTGACRKRGVGHHSLGGDAQPSMKLTCAAPGGSCSVAARLEERAAAAAYFLPARCARDHGLAVGSGPCHVRKLAAGRPCQARCLGNLLLS